ncbi:response regulator [Leptolyngbya sp. FACHB-17]|uniref:response regulator n=1 Tax=unclassified Leptolyngbya TaxID=2650499 RepID=UPI0016807601|nr:response regulator [Leptolyngbya sp. FACHB-17]MBD2080852.1 response regulator [Leptolyngbya sp. FACHB-17]
MLSTNHRVLIVDDVADNLILLQTILEAEAYTVETALSGRAALDKIEQINPDLVLLDIMMPGLNGYDVTRQVRQNERFASLPIVLLTAHDEYFQRPYREIGANDLIRKPIDFDELLNKVSIYTNFHSNTA